VAYTPRREHALGRRGDFINALDEFGAGLPHASAVIRSVVVLADLDHA
jgi:hypothetical protein